LVEYKKLGRGNKTVDHRIGENDPSMSFDEKMAKRFALERQVLACVYLTVFFSIFRSFGLSYFMPYCFYASAHPIDELEALWFGVVCPSMLSAHAHTPTPTSV